MGSLPLSDEDRAQLSARADEFHAALIRGGVTDWGKYLAGLPDHIRLMVLAELVIIDLSYRWEKGERPRVEDYLERFPELGPPERVPPAVVLEEHRCRMKAGERPDPESFQARFPVQYPSIRGEIEAGRGATIAGTAGTLAADTDFSLLEQTPESGHAEADYDFIRVLGRGVFGEVWLARKRTSGIEKAVKILHPAENPEPAERERRALELIKNLRHPYLLATDDFWVAGGRLHIAMELADGTLRDELRRCRLAKMPGIPLPDLIRYTREAAEGLDVLHAQNVIHRDVKPDNILLLQGHAKVGDFGLARYHDEVQAPARAFAGTPAYMSPEAWGRTGGPRSDQYSLAVTYAELRQGFPPLRPRPIQEMLLALSQGDYEFSEVITPAERAVILKALSPDPADRYPSCLAFIDALAAELAAASPDPLPLPDKGTRPRTLWKPLAIGLLVAVVAGGSAISFWNLGSGTEAGRGEQKNVWAPPGATPVEGAEVVKLADGRALSEWVQAELGGEVVRFRLIASASGPPVRPFYIMESKVWNKLYRAGGRTPLPVSADNGMYAPVTLATQAEAAAFAAKFPGGRLPTPDEWDHAAGLYLGKDGAVALPGGRPVVNEAKPSATHGPRVGSDLNEFGLRDMAGNGREWTCGILNRTGERLWSVRNTPPGPEDLAVLRGKTFTSKYALTFAQLRDEQATPQTQYAASRSPETSFRVVLPGS